MLEKVISSGQTGISRLALEIARDMSIETGGTAAWGWLTESGTDESLKEFGLKEAEHTGFCYRTNENVKNSDGTIIFGDASYRDLEDTIEACQKHKKPYLLNPISPAEIYAWIKAKNIKTLNINGNKATALPVGEKEYRKAVLIETFHLLGF